MLQVLLLLSCLCYLITGSVRNRMGAYGLLRQNQITTQQSDCDLKEEQRTERAFALARKRSIRRLLRRNGGHHAAELGCSRNGCRCPLAPPVRGRLPGMILRCRSHALTLAAQAEELASPLWMPMA